MLMSNSNLMNEVHHVLITVYFNVLTLIKYT